jgi:uracil-DNA glycosylase
VRKSKFTGTVAAWRTQWSAVLPMSYPSPRNNIWLKLNPWFVAEVVPALPSRVAALL